MDKVIATLYSIEERAQRIMETTANEKLSLKDYFEGKKRAYEKESNENTRLKLSELSTTLKEQFDNEYTESQKQTEKLVNALSLEFEQNHTKMAEDIFKQIIEV